MDLFKGTTDKQQFGDIKIITFDPKTQVTSVRVASEAEAEKILKETEGKFSETDGEPMFLKNFREELKRRASEALP